MNALGSNIFAKAISSLSAMRADAVVNSPSVKIRRLLENSRLWSALLNKETLMYAQRNMLLSADGLARMSNASGIHVQRLTAMPAMPVGMRMLLTIRWENARQVIACLGEFLF